MEWQPIATAPPNEPIEVAAFPCVTHQPNITLVTDMETMRSCHPEWTHWRPVTPETARHVRESAGLKTER